MNRLSGVLLGLLTVSVLGCKDDDRLPGRTKAALAAPVAPKTDTVRVGAAVGPVGWLACQVAGEPCRATVLVPPGASAHSFEPKPSLLSELGGVKLYFSAGLAFEEGWVPRLKSGLPELEVVALRPPEALPSQDRHDHDHDHGEQSDPHFWSSPRAMNAVADSMALALVRAYPNEAARIGKSRDSLHARLLRLDTLLRRELAPFSGKHFYVNHPELGYLAHDYGLVQEPLEEGGREPSLSFVLEARRVARSQGIRAVFAQEAYGTRTAQAFAKELSVPVVSVDLYAAPWDSAIVKVAKALASSL